MLNERIPSVELALSLASPFPRSRDPDLEVADAPSALPQPAWSERREVMDEDLGLVAELCQNYEVGADMSLTVHWLLDPQDEDAPPSHIRCVEIDVNGERTRLRRGQMDDLGRALEMADYLFETMEREELGRRTC